MATQRLRFKWNGPANCWVVDVLDVAGNPVVAGLAVVTGADLLEQFGHLDLGGQLIAQTAHDTDAVPTFSNLGGDGQLFYLSP
jgi:hypothetical protein